MFVLGLKPSLGGQLFGWHDGGACLLDDNNIVAAAEEERFTREKHATNTFPNQSIQYVLDEGSLEFSDIDIISIGRNEKKLTEYIKQNSDSLPSVSGRTVYELSRLFKAYRGDPKRLVKNHLKDSFGIGSISATMYEVSHHRCHAASAHYCAPLDEPITITIDSQGEYDSTVLWDRQLNRVKTFPWDNSVGHMYSKGVKYLGYRHSWDAGKVMGLASYGNYREEFARRFDELVPVGDGRYDTSKLRDADNAIALLETHFGDRREYPNPFTQRHKDFAFHLQLKTEEIAKELVQHHVDQTDTDKLALAGGVAMNCKMNREILDMDCVEDLFIQPAANDSGIALGAALEGYRRHTGTTPDPEFRDVYLGPQYEGSDIKELLERAKITYEVPNNVCQRAAELLAEGQLVGWFQGRMELGARALGNRSILADPTSKDSLDKVNENVKDRELWRPFAPSLLFEARNDYLVSGDEAPFMILLDTVRDGKRSEIPAVTHVDGTTRPQTVRLRDNERYYRLIEEFEKLTGVPVLLNTSFNVSGEPIVESPKQALRDFYSIGLDALVLGDYIVTKRSS